MRKFKWTEESSEDIRLIRIWSSRINGLKALVNIMVSGFGIEKEMTQISSPPKKNDYCNGRERMTFEVKIKSRV